MRDANDSYLGAYEAEQVRADREAEAREEYIDYYKAKQKKELGLDYVAEVFRESQDEDFSEAWAVMGEGALSFGAEMLKVIDAYWTRQGGREFDERN